MAGAVLPGSGSGCGPWPWDIFLMNKSIVSLCQEWQSYQLPEWRRQITNTEASLFYSESIDHILKLVDDLASVRAYLRLIDQRRDQLAKQALRWDISHDPTNIEFCWNCYFLNHSFNPDDATQIIKTLKTCFYKETYELREGAASSSSTPSRLIESSIIQRIMKLKNGILNWKLALGFSADLGDILKGIRYVIESRMNNNPPSEAFDEILEDMETLFRSVFSATSGGSASGGGSCGDGNTATTSGATAATTSGATAATTSGATAATTSGATAATTSGAAATTTTTTHLPTTTTTSPLMLESIRRCEEVVLVPCGEKFGEYVRMRYEVDRAEISNLISAHYKRIEVNLSDYLSQFKIYDPNREILKLIDHHRAAHQNWSSRRALWSRYLKEPSSWPVDDQIDLVIEENISRAKEILLSQLRTLERIRRKSLDKDNVILNICDSDRRAWLRAEGAAPSASPI